MGNSKNDLKSMFTEHWKYMAVAAACKLNLFDKIHQGQNTPTRLLENGWSEKALTFLLNYLIWDDYIIVANDKFCLLEKGDLLREQNQEGLYYACLNWTVEHLDAWRELESSIVTGESSFENKFQTTFFNYLEMDEQKRDSYHKAMYQYAIDDYGKLTEIIDFSDYKSVLDVGGGYGAAIKLIKQKNPDVDCILFDLPEVVQIVSNESIRIEGGDFFSRLPFQVDALLLSRIIHDWNDQQSSIILRNCYDALHPGGTMYLIENCVDLVKGDFSLLSLNMIAMCGSYERSSEEFIHLCQSEGFQYEQHKKLNDLQTILIFRK